jgi:RNA polymerase sigma-70 factor (ECF subfamily)
MSMPARASALATPAPGRPSAATAGRSSFFANDEREFRAALVDLVPHLRARALRLCGGDSAAADDVVQDAVERALRFSHQYERGTNLRAWAFQVLFSVFVTRWRRRRRERNALSDLASDPYAWTIPGGFVAPDAGDGVMTKTTLRTLGALPEGFRDVVILVDLEERSYLDAAEKLGVPVGTVMSRLHRGRRLLAEKMKAHAGGPAADEVKRPAHRAAA